MNRIDVERRDRPALGNVELRSAASGETRLTGYAAKFNSRTTIGGYFIEELAPGCFANSLMRSDVRALCNHNENYLLGRTASGTLTLSEDATGLRFDLIPPNTGAGRDTLESVRRGDLSGMSFAFQSLKERWDDSGPLPIRRIEECDLFEISCVVWPQYEDTTCAMRSGKSNSPFREIQPASVVAAVARMKQGIVGRERPHNVCH